MNILLFNNNPVVNKLVTLSAQKTSNTVDTAQNIDDIESKKYDILIIDDALYSPEIMEEISSKIEYKKSLYICSKDAKATEEFTKILKKPFLPTDLVELLISLSKETKEASAPQFDLLDDTNVLEKSDNLDEMEDIESFDFDELDSLDEETEDSKISQFDELDIQDDIDFEALDDTSELDDTDINPSSKTTEGVLDKEELQEVQNLLDETEAENDAMLEDFDFEDDLEFDEDTEKSEDEEDELSSEGDDFSFEESGEDELLENLTDDTTQTPATTEDDLDFSDEDDDFSFEEETKEEQASFDEDALKEEELSLDEPEIDEDDDFSFDGDDKEEASFDEAEEETPLDELHEDEELSFDDAQEELLSDISKSEETEASIEEDFEEEADFDEDSFENESDDLKSLESKIQSAVKELSDEDLESEVDEDMLLDIDSLTSRDLKLAIGEEVDEDAFAQPNDEPVFEQEIQEDAQMQKSVAHSVDDNSSNDGVEALKKLLKALSNEDVAASLKGMKININITLGDNQ